MGSMRDTEEVPESLNQAGGSENRQEGTRST